MEDKITKLALIPARSGSLRVPDKNITLLAGHPLIAYTICAARASNEFDGIIVSTDSEHTAEIAKHYGAEVPFMRPKEYATSTSPDIEWIKHAFSQLDKRYDAFSILRPTSPFRMPETIQRAWKKFLSLKSIDSLRAVQLCKEHPGKMWTVEGDSMKPLLDQSHLDVAWHAGQYQALPKVYIQNSSLEIAWVKTVEKYNSREGKVIAPFITEATEGFAIDYKYDLMVAEKMVELGEAALPKIDKDPFQVK